MPRSGARRGSRPHVPSEPVTERRKWRQVEQVVEEVAQTQHRAVSGCGVPHVGQRQVGMARSVAALAAPCRQTARVASASRSRRPVRRRYGTLGLGVGVGGATVGLGVGSGVGDGVGEGVGRGVGDGVGSGVGDGVGGGVGDGVGLGVGSGPFETT